MAREAAADAELTQAPIVPRAPRRPIYSDPLSLVGWGVALAAILAYWYFFVRHPLPSPGEAVARLTAVEGRVRVKPNAEERWTQARLSDRLRVGDVLQTEAGSGAVIWFDGDPRQPGSGSVVQVRPDSVVYIGGSAEASTAAWRVQTGNVSFTAGAVAAEIATPSVRTTALANASGSIHVGERGETGIRVFGGQAELQTRIGQRITLAENQAVRVDAGGRVGALIALPPPPTLAAPAPRALLPFVPPPGAVTTLRWMAVVGGVSYRVAIDYNVTQADLVLATALEAGGIATTEHALRDLVPGRYFWRVAAMNADGLEGAFSRPSSFSVESAPPPSPSPTPVLGPPRLLVQVAEEVSPGVVYVSGRADPGCQVTVDGAPLRLLPDGSFREYVRHAARDAVIVRATRSDGRVTERARPITRRSRVGG